MPRPAARRLAAWVVVLASWMLAVRPGAAQSDAVLPALLAEARANVLAARWDAAEASYTRVLALSPDSLEALDERGTAYDEQGQPDKARADYERAILLRTANPRDAFFRGDAYQSLERRAEADGDLRTAVTLTPLDAYDFRLRATADIGLRQYREAVGDCDAILRAQPGSALAYKLRGQAENALRNYPAEQADAEAAIRLAPSYAAAYDVRARAYEAQGRIDLALRDADEAVRLQPGRWAVWSYRGYLHHRMKRDDLALPDMNEALRLHPDDVVLLRSRSGILFDAGQYDLAARDMDETARLRPKKTDNSINRAAGYNSYTAGNAVRDLGETATFTPGSARAFAPTNARALPFPDAAPAVAPASHAPAAEIPGLTLLPDRLARARAGILAARWREAADAYAQVLVTTPDSLEALAEHALACTHLGETARAAADVNRAVALQPTNLRDYYFKAAAGDLSGWHGEATPDARMAEALDPRDAFDLWVRGRAHLFQENDALADADFIALLRGKPPSATAFVQFERGRASFGAQQYGRAVEAYGQALQSEPEFREAHAGRAEAYRALGRRAEADADEAAARKLPVP